VLTVAPAYGMEAAALRLFNVYGPGQVGQGALSTFLLRALKAEPTAFTDKPLDWLKSGPGRETTDSTGWTGPARPQAGDGAAGRAAVPASLDPGQLAELEAYAQRRERT